MPRPQHVQDRIDARREGIRMGAPLDLRKIAGVEFAGVKCSATMEDQNGLLAVQLRVQQALQAGSTWSTFFKFENGTVLELGTQNFAEFAGVWIPFRESFFQDPSIQVASTPVEEPAVETPAPAETTVEETVTETPVVEETVAEQPVVEPVTETPAPAPEETPTETPVEETPVE